MSPSTDGDGLRAAFEELIEKALTGARRLNPIEVRDLADGLSSAIDAHIERRVRMALAERPKDVASYDVYWRQPST